MKEHVSHTWQLGCPNAGTNVLTKPQALSFEDEGKKGVILIPN